MTGQKRKRKFNTVKADKRRHIKDLPSTSLDAAIISGATQLQQSRLADLPTELVQQIFLYSANYELPLVSRALLNQLSDISMVCSIMTTLLRPFGPTAARPPNAEERRMVRGMFQRRFFTMDLLRDCCYQIMVEYDKAPNNKQPIISSSPRLLFPPVIITVELHEWLSGSVQHSQLPMFRQRFEDHLSEVVLHANLPDHFPSRYLRGPWTHERTQFLELYLYICRSRGPAVNNERSLTKDRMMELASRPQFSSALNDAVESNSLQATKLLCNLFVPIEQEHLRVAVKYSSTIPNVFSLLVYESLLVVHPDFRQVPDGIGFRKLDYLDRVLWVLATEMKEARDGRGDMIMDQLRGAAQDQAVCLSYPPDTTNVLEGPLIPDFNQWLQGSRFEHRQKRKNNDSVT